MRHDDQYPLVVDHDHSKQKGDFGFIRGLLCDDCNNGLGRFKDSFVLLDKASKYLEATRG